MFYLQPSLQPPNAIAHQNQCYKESVPVSQQQLNVHVKGRLIVHAPELSVPVKGKPIARVHKELSVLAKDKPIAHAQGPSVHVKAKLIAPAQELSAHVREKPIAHALLGLNATAQRCLNYLQTK